MNEAVGRRAPSVAGVAGGVGTTTIARALAGVDRGVFTGRPVDVLVCRATADSLLRAARAAYLISTQQHHRPVLAVNIADTAGPQPPEHGANAATGAPYRRCGGAALCPPLAGFRNAAAGRHRPDRPAGHRPASAVAPLRLGRARPRRPSRPSHRSHLAAAHVGSPPRDLALPRAHHPGAGSSDLSAEATESPL